MAKFAFLRTGSDGGKAGPFSRHPAFPYVVAIWFAALLGIGSLLLPVVLFERFVETVGLAGFIPSAAPPLGTKARLLIAAGSGLFGALLGLSIARRVASAHASPAEARLSRLDPDARKPVSVREEIDLEEPAGRDLRAFLVPFTPAPPPPPEPDSVIDADWDLVPELIPPGRDRPQVEPEAEVEAEVEVVCEAQADAGFAPEAEPAPEPEFDPVEVAAPAIDWRLSDQPYEGPEMTEVQDAWPDPDRGQWQYPVEPEATAAADPEPAPQFERHAVPELDAEVAEIDPAQVMPGQDLAESPPPEPVQPEPAVPESAQPEPAVVEPEPGVAQLDESRAHTPRYVELTDLSVDPGLPSLDDLPLPDLVRRLAATIEKRREWIAASRAAAAEAQRARPEAFEPAPAEEAAQAMAAWFSASGQGFVHAQTPAPDWAPPVAEPPEQEAEAEAEAEAEEAPALLRPAFLDWFEHGEDDEDDLPLPSLNLPRREPIALAPVFDPESEVVEAEAEAEAAIADEEAYGSLIGMKNPFAPPRSDFIRIDEDNTPEAIEETLDCAEEPQERPDISQTDAALRAALASLQRISGAA